MTPEEIAAQKAAAVKAAAEEARTQALAAEAHRTAAIRALFKPFDSHRSVMDACLDDQACDEAAASKKLVAAMAVDAKPLRDPNAQPDIKPGATSREKFLVGAEKALFARLGGERDPGNEFNGSSLVDIGARALNLAGIETRGMSRDQIARRVLATHSTSDFPLLLSNVARKRLRDAYNTVERTWDKLAHIGSVPDFKVNSRLTLGSFSSLVLKPEGGEYKQGTFGEETLSIKAQTKGRYISFTRELFVNDDLNGFANISRKMGQAAGRTVEIDFYAMLALNSNLGPTLPDTGTFFNATAVTQGGPGHANYTTPGTAISSVSLGVALAMMQRQQDVGRNEYVVIKPKILLVSPEKYVEAWTIVNNATETSQANPSRKSFAATLNLTVIASPYLTGSAWYLFADPNDVEAFEVAFLDGQQEPFIDEEIEFMTDNWNMKVRLDYGLGPIDFRAAYRNAGA